MDTVFKMASDEKIAVLGINDFYVTDGYDAFHKGCLENKIFPLFNIEFIGLLKEEQKKGIRINDPNNPGRIYFSGKGLDYPFETGWMQRRQLKSSDKGKSGSDEGDDREAESADYRRDNPHILLSYNSIKEEFAQELVRERHIAKALRVLAARRFCEPEQQLEFLEKLYGAKNQKPDYLMLQPLKMK